jgi:transcriptional regulator with XRE-family HTH domain
MRLLVQELRRAKGLTQAELATRAGCSRELISSIETARSSPTIARLEEIAQALGVPVQALLPRPPRRGRPCHRALSAPAMARGSGGGL